MFDWLLSWDFNSKSNCVQQELRDNNVLTFLEDDQNRRKDDLHKAKPKIIPSGGLAGFRVAPDLMNMDVAAIDPNGD